MMQATKSIQAINGDRISVAHRSLDLSNRMSTYATVRFDGIAHMVVSTPAASAHGMAMTTAKFTVNGNDARVVEKIDSNDVGKASVRYEGVLESEAGSLWVQTYESADQTTALLAALDPQATPLGVVIGVDAGVEYVTAPEVLFEIPGFALLGIAPLTKEVNHQLPDWEGTRVTGGELFAGALSRSVPLIILVTPTARVNIQPNHDVDIDEAVRLASQLSVSWTPA